MTMLAQATPGFWQDKRVLLTGHTGFKGGWLAFKRIMRCHPFHTGEHEFYDPVP